MSSIINNLQEKLVDVSDQIIRVMEEGTSIIMGLAQEDDGSNQTPPSGAEGTFNDQMDDIEITVDEEDLVGMKSPLDGITEGVLGDIMKNQATPTTIIDKLDAFRSAITWEEPFIMGVVTFHICMFFMTLFVTRRCGMGSGMILLTFMAGLVRSAEWLNTYGSKNWEDFATQNYFDDHGIFISVMMSGPLLLLAFIMLISYLRQASTLLIKVKRHEMQQKQKKTQGKASRGKKGKKASKKED